MEKKLKPRVQFFKSFPALEINPPEWDAVGDSEVVERKNQVAEAAMVGATAMGCRLQRNER